MRHVNTHRFEWTKDRTEFLIKNVPTMSPMELAKHIGCGTDTIYNKIAQLGMQGVRKRVVTEASLAKRSMQQKERVAREKRHTWPQVVTTMAAALCGRVFEDVETKPPAQSFRVRTRWVGDIGEAKSSMGWK